MTQTDRITVADKMLVCFNRMVFVCTILLLHWYGKRKLLRYNYAGVQGEFLQPQRLHTDCMSQILTNHRRGALLSLLMGHYMLKYSASNGENLLIDEEMIYTHIYSHALTYTHSHFYTHPHTYIYTHTYLCIQLYTHTDIHTYIHTHTHTFQFYTTWIHHFIQVAP